MKNGRFFFRLATVLAAGACIGTLLFFVVARQRTSHSVERQSFAMGTVITLKAWGSPSDAARLARVLDEAVAQVASLDALMSTTRDDSQISRLNRSSGRTPLYVSPVLADAIQKALSWARASEGTFDPTIYPLSYLWKSAGKIPSNEEIADARSLVNYRHVQVSSDDQGIRVALADKGMGLDLGGIAKGYATDLLVDFFKQNGVRSAQIDLGGNIFAYGPRTGHDAWLIGIQHPEKPRGQPLARLRVEGKAVVTSGSYERFFEQDGEKYHHILDVKTGRPARSGLESVTVICASATDADALSTTLFVLGLEKSLQVIQKIPGVEAVFVTTDRRVVATPLLVKKKGIDPALADVRYRFEVAP